MTRLRRRLGTEGSGKFQRDVLWNVVSLGILGVSGVLLNFLIGYYYDAAVLGVFNQVFAAYIVFSQFAVGGVHFSALKHIAEQQDDRRVCSSIILAALALGVISSTLSAVVFLLSRTAISTWLESPGVAVGMAWVAPGLFFFAINKILLGVLNAYRRMQLYAFLQGLRPLLWIAALFTVALRKLPGDVLPLILSVAELVVFVIASLSVRRHLRAAPRNILPWVRVHFDFGIRSLGSGVLSELNTRVDVLMLGLFAADRLVGIYSFAAMVAEGIFQFLIVLRNNYNPILVKRIAARDQDGMLKLIRKGKKVTYLLMSVITLVAIAIFPLVAGLLGDEDDFRQGWPFFITLMGGIFIGSGYVPFGAILLQAGRPGLHTIMIGILVALNVVLNALLIPPLAGLGAALATAVTFVASMVLLRFLTRQTLGVSI